MRILRFAVCFGVLLLPISSTSQISSLRGQGEMHGPVLLVTVESARISNKDESTELNRRKVDVVSYDEIGRPRKRDVYDDYGFRVGTEVYEYSPNGLSCEATFSDLKAKKIERRVYEYNSTGKITSIKTYDGRNRLTVQRDYQPDAGSERIIEVIRSPPQGRRKNDLELK